MIGDLPTNKLHRSPARPDLAPLVDVFFLLLVFFLLTASTQRVVSVDLPPAEGNPRRQEIPTITLTLYADGEWGVENRRLSHWPDVQRAVRQYRSRHDTLNVTIEGDRHVPLDRLVQVLDFLQSEGLFSVHLLIQPQPQPQGGTS